MSYDPEKMLKSWGEYSKLIKEKEQEEIKHQSDHAIYSGQKERSWQEEMYVDADKPGTIDNVAATIWYIIIMLVGAIFKDRWLIWIPVTVIWWCHITRKKRRQKEWDEKKNGGNK